MEKRTVNEHYELLAVDLINKEKELAYIANSPVDICFLESNMIRKNGKHSYVYGECEKVPAKYKWGIKADFTITLFKPNIEHLTEDQIRILLFHELLHIGIEKKPDGTFSYSTVKHDLEDFKTIVDRFGTSWADATK